MDRFKIFGNILPLVFWIFVSLGAPCYSLGAEEEKNVSPEEMRLETDRETPADSPAPVPTLPTVTVVAAPEDRATGKSTIGREAIERLPEGNGSVNELLKVLPGVQLSDKADTSLQAGEILPPKVSISGGRVFQNNFLIDGIANNSLLDPVADNPSAIDDVPGHPQSIFFDPDLVEKITVFRSNIPARFGSFTGGVVEVTTRNPGPEFGGKVSYRATRDAWTRFHLDDEEKADFEQSKNHLRQPEFVKHDGGLELNVPINEKAGILTSYQVIRSEISLTHLGGAKEQSRRLENYFFKSVYDPTPSDRLSLSLIHAPYRGEYFVENAINSDYTLKGGGLVANAEYDNISPLGELRLNAAYRASENSRQAAPHWFNWKITPSKSWGERAGISNSREGGFGDIEKTEDSVQFKGHFDFTPVTTGMLRHLFNAGFDYERTRGTFDHKNTTFSHNTAVESADVICDRDVLACVEGEQYFTRRSVYEAESVTATTSQYHLYVEDLIRFGRLELRPGVRYSYDDFLRNKNVGPRLAATYDLFGDHGTILIAGANRYYGRPLLTFKLREAKRPFRIEKRDLGPDNRPTDWVLSLQTNTATRFSDLDTPFSDEITFGLDQALLGGRLIAEYIRREAKDEFARQRGEVQPDGLRYYTLNNNGRTHHEEYGIAWQRQWSGHFLSVNATYQETETSAEDYETLLDEETLSERVWYKGSALSQDELPRDDFNRNWVANLTYSASLPFGFTFTNFTRYRSGYRTLKSTGDSIVLDDGEELPIYTREEQPESWIFDWKIDWSRRIVRNQALVVSLEIDNVFNKKVPVGAQEDEFELGRRFWAGAEYRF
jgi:hypothetical protein